MHDQTLAAYGDARHAGGLSLSLKTWSADVILCTDGRPAPRGSEAARLRRHGVPVYPERIARLEGRDGVLERIVFANGESVACRAMFFSTGQVQRSPLAERLGCEFNEKGTIRTNRREGTHIPGLYVAGDASRDVQFVIVAAAEGAKAAVAINKALEKELG
jgi:thioredoxin reductase